MDAAHLKLARRSLAGLGCNKFKKTDGGKKCTSERSEQVRQYMSLGTIDDELRIARLKFWQNIARDPEHHTQIVTTFFGTFKFSNGNLKDDKFHGRYIQLQEDLQHMRQLDLEEKIGPSLTTSQNTH